MKAISIRADGTITQVDVDPDNFTEFQSYINDDFPNIVRRGPVELTEGVMVVADTGLLHDDWAVNPLASVLYGGNFIKGDVLIIGEEMTHEGADFCDLPDPTFTEHVLRRVQAGLSGS